MAATRRKEVDHSVPELPRSPQVGDKVRINPTHRNAIVTACQAAGWDIDVDEVRTVLREDPYCPGGGRRLFVDGPPFAFAAMQVELAWPDGPQSDARRKAITERGWRP